jgi:hypothetical protein
MTDLQQYASSALFRARCPLILIEIMKKRHANLRGRGSRRAPRRSLYDFIQQICSAE